MPIIFDNVIFGLQARGGISTYWRALLELAPSDSLILSHRAAERNNLWNSISTKFSEINVSSTPLSVDRYLPVFGVPKKANVFHSSYYRVPAGKTPSVQTAYDFVYEKYRTGLPKTIHSLQKRIALASADRICCISESTRRDLIDLYGSKFEKKSIVTHLAASEIYRPIDNARETLAASGKYPFLQKGRPYLVFIGSRRPNDRVSHEKSYKRFNLAVEALRHLKEYDLVVIGGEKWNEADQSLADSVHVSNQIITIGGIPEDELPFWYNGAHALLYLSDYEGFGLPVLEASQCRCPVIAQKSSSIPEIHGSPGFLLREILDGAVAAKVRSLESADLRKEIISQCSAHSMNFSWANTWQTTLAAYNDLTAN